MEPFLFIPRNFFRATMRSLLYHLSGVAHFAHNWPGSRASDGWNTTYYIMAKALSAPEYQQLHTAIESALITASRTVLVSGSAGKSCRGIGTT